MVEGLCDICRDDQAGQHDSGFDTAYTYGPYEGEIGG